MLYPPKYKKTIIAIHIAVWLIVILAPLTFFDKGDKFEADKLIPMISSPLMMMAVFYTMYLHITPKFLFREDKRKFWTYTILLVLGAGIVLHLWLSFSHNIFFKPESVPPEYFPKPKNGGHGFRHRMHHSMEYWFMLRNIFSMIVTAAIAAMSVITIKWHSAEVARKEAELARRNAELAKQKAETARADAELKNLRNQINPHFLLNTLNNIYALTAFDQQKAQDAILQLSGMLRHILYDNQQEFVLLRDEVTFIQSYINLMKIRIAKTCDISIDVDVPENSDIRIAPLIFISLIENAFKHGIAATGRSFINILVKADEKCIECFIENSNHPKEQSDRSGHGIGLMQVEKRLKLSYGENYLWEKGVNDDNTIYHSKIIIYDTKLRNNPD